MEEQAGEYLGLEEGALLRHDDLRVFESRIRDCHQLVEAHRMESDRQSEYLDSARAILDRL